VSVGEAIAVALLDLHGLNPHSRLIVARPPKPLWPVVKGDLLEASRGLERLFKALAKRHFAAQSPAASPGLPMEIPLYASLDSPSQRRVFKVMHGPHVNVRDRPSKDGRTLGSKMQGDTVLVLQVRRDGWLQLDASEVSILKPHSDIIEDDTVDAFMLMQGGFSAGLHDLLADTGEIVNAPPVNDRGRPAGYSIAACVAPLVEDVEAGRYPILV
jgi:hypothetical protein